MPEKPKLSIIILNYNTQELLQSCLQSLQKVEREVDFETIVVDNGSSDGSADLVRQNFQEVILLKNSRNLGFAAGNNVARSKAAGEYILFLNSDTQVPEGTLKKSLEYLEANQDIGALTVKILLPNGKLDKDTRRSFITPWIGLIHLFLRLDRIFPESKYFGRYWYGFISPDKTHEVDVIQGAYFLTRKKVLDEVDWFDEDYFLDGEDIDLCWRIKERGLRIVYFPEVSILHNKGASKGKVESANRSGVPLSERLKFRMAGVDSMEKFYRKRLWSKYPLPLNILVLIGIKILKGLRYVRTVVLG